MDTLIDYLNLWEMQQPDKTLYRFLDIEGRQLEHHTFGSFAERTRELAAYLSLVPASFCFPLTVIFGLRAIKCLNDPQVQSAFPS